VKEIILFGAGQRLLSTLKICRLLRDCRVVEIWDNHPVMDSVSFGGEEIPVCRPHAMQVPMAVYILPRRYEEAIRSQLMHELRIPVEQLFSYWDLFTDCREDIVAHYADAKDPELQRAVRFIATHGLRIFPDASVEALYAKEEQITVSLDEVTGLWYGDWHGRRLYMRRGMKRSHAQSYLMSLIAEQSPQSAHHYPDVTEDVPFDTVIDCGAAEGCFALDYLGKVKDIYLFEGDADWQEPLKRTFARGGGYKYTSDSALGRRAGGWPVYDDRCIGAVGSKSAPQDGYRRERVRRTGWCGKDPAGKSHGAGHRMQLSSRTGCRADFFVPSRTPFPRAIFRWRDVFPIWGVD